MNTRPAESSPPTLHLSPSVNHRHLCAQTTPAMHFPGEAGGGVSAWQQRLRAKLLELVGPPDAYRPPLAVQTLGRIEDELGVIHKIAFSAEPYADIVAYFCLPHRLAPPYPVMICLQGHTSGMHCSIGRQYDDETTPLTVEGDRDFALGAMRHGYAALCLEQRSFGYRKETVQQPRSDRVCHDAAMQALLLGRTLLGERVFDVDRGLDYLAERGDIDMTRVGVMGNSGGGTVSIYAAALLDRVAFAMPSCAFCTFADSIMSINGCADNYVPGILRWAEAADILGLFAPKPVVVVAGRGDPIFPLHGVRRAFDDLQAIYAAAGAEDNCRLVIGDGDHRFYERQGWAAMLDLLRRSHE